MLTRLKIASLCIFCLGVPVALWEWYRILPGAIVEQPKVSYPELITILLTGLTVAFALFAGIVGVLALWGYTNIKDEAGAAARAAVDASVRAAMDRHQEALRATIKETLRPIVQEVVQENMPADLTAVWYSSAFPQGTGQQAAPTEPIADELPGEDNEAR